MRAAERTKGPGASWWPCGAAWAQGHPLSWAPRLTRLPTPQSGPIVSRDTGRCLEVEMSKDANFGLRLVVQRCSGQKWMIRNWIKHGQH